MSLVHDGDPIPSIWLVITEVGVYIATSVLVIGEGFLTTLDHHAAGLGVLIAFATFLANRNWSNKRKP